MPSRVRTIRWCGYELPLWMIEAEISRRIEEQEQTYAGAEVRTRTGMPPQDFESRASTSSATPAEGEANPC